MSCRTIGLSVVLLCLFSVIGCRVVDAPLKVPTQTKDDNAKSLIRDGLEPSLKTMTQGLNAVGVVYKASVSLASRRSERKADARIMDGSNFFAPSPDDKLEISPLAASEATRFDEPSNPASPVESALGREVYDFKYTMNAAQTMALGDPDLKLKVGANGFVEVKEGQPHFLSLDVYAEVYSRSATDPSAAIATFKIANLSRIGQSDSQKIEVSFSEYRRLIHFVSEGSEDSVDANSGVLQLVITKENATLTVTDLLLDSSSSLRFESMNAVWTFESGDFTAGAKLSFIDSKQEKFGVDVQIDANSEVVTNVWKWETADPRTPSTPENPQPPVSPVN
jgi:hypothetical protein